MQIPAKHDGHQYSQIAKNVKNLQGCIWKPACLYFAAFVRKPAPLRVPSEVFTDQAVEECCCL